MSIEPTTLNAANPQSEKPHGGRRKKTVAVAAGAAVLVAVGLLTGLSGGSPSPTQTASAAKTSTSVSAKGGDFHGGGTPPAGKSGAPAGGGGSNARSAPSPGGAAGTVTSASSTSFSMTTSEGQKVTVDVSGNTTYQPASTPVSTNETVLVLGVVNTTTIQATQVSQIPASSSYVATSSKVISFKRGTPTITKQAGALPAGWSQGSGTIISGATANEAAEAALAAYPGAVVDRVVKLSDGEYNVHYIGVNWPHHVFVSSVFNVVGAE